VWNAIFADFVVVQVSAKFSTLKVTIIRTGLMDKLGENKK